MPGVGRQRRHTAPQHHRDGGQSIRLPGLRFVLGDCSGGTNRRGWLRQTAPAAPTLREVWVVSGARPEPAARAGGGTCDGRPACIPGRNDAGRAMGEAAASLHLGQGRRWRPRDGRGPAPSRLANGRPVQSPIAPNRGSRWPPARVLRLVRGWTRPPLVGRRLARHGIRANPCSPEASGGPSPRRSPARECRGPCPRQRTRGHHTRLIPHPSNTGSGLTITSPSAIACAARSRSNGSRCPPSRPATSAWRALNPNVMNSCSSR